MSKENYNSLASEMTKLEKASLMIAQGLIIDIDLERADIKDEIESFSSVCCRIAKTILDKANEVENEL